VVAATIIAPAATAVLRLRDITHTAAVALQPALPKKHVVATIIIAPAACEKL
jgi:hypothetical protein